MAAHVEWGCAIHIAGGAAMTARVIGLWTAQHTPRLLVDYPHPGVVTCNDVTGEDAPPDSPGVWEIAADAATTAAI